MLPKTLFVQEKEKTLFVNRTIEGAAGHNPPADRVIGKYVLEKEVRIVQTVTIEDVPAAEIAAAAPQN